LLANSSNVGNKIANQNPLTERQQETFEAYTARKNGEGRALTEKQLSDWGDLYKKANAKPKLTDGAKKFLDSLVWEELTGRRTVLKNKYLDKGIQAEEKSLTLYSSVKESLTLKNKTRIDNKWFTGECDITRYKVRDIKSSWSFETFPLQDEEIPNSDYEWQLDVYMDLYGYKRAELIYCLVDTPFKLIEDELRRLDWKFDIMDISGDIKKGSIPLVVETVTNHIYTFIGLESFCQQSTNVNIEWFDDFKELPEEMRVKIFKQNFSQERLDLMKNMVVLARDYMNDTLLKIGGSAIKLKEIKKAV